MRRVPGQPANGKPLHVLIVSHTATISGGELALLDLIQSLPRDVSVTLACPQGELASRARGLTDRVLTIPPVDVSFRIEPLRVPRNLWAAGRSVRALRSIIVERRPDVVHANSVRAGLLASAALTHLPYPLIVHVHDVLPAGATARVVREIVCRRAAVVVANSEFTARRFAVRGSRAAFRAPPSPVDLARFQPDALEKDQARQVLDVPRSSPVLGVVGQLTPWKGQDDAIRIAASLVPRFPHLVLLIVGEPRFVSRNTRYDNRTYAGHLRELAAALGVAAHVRFLGHRDDIPTVMRALDALLVPSWTEPFGRCVVEGMAMETPVVATSVGGPAEIIADGSTGFLRPPRRPTLWLEPIARLLDEPALRSSIGRAARDRAQTFDAPHHATAIAEIYRNFRGTPECSPEG
jgi:L-malate glycosyltransferase